MTAAGLSVAGTVALALVAVQLLVTLIFQVRPLSTRFARMDMLGIIPRWKFFIIDTGTYDLAVEYREDGGAWRTIWTPPPRRAWGWLWKPDGFHDGVVWLAAYTLGERIAAGRSACPETSSAYATILHLCRRAAGDPGAARQSQFALIRITPDGVRHNRFTSPFHIL